MLGYDYLAKNPLGTTCRANGSKTQTQVCESPGKCLTSMPYGNIQCCFSNVIAYFWYLLT